jgi:hypothetical protein
MSHHPAGSHSAAAAAGSSIKLLIVGLYGEAIKVDWRPDEDSVGDIKTKAFRAAENTLLADGSTRSMVQGQAACNTRANSHRRNAAAAGVTLEQLVVMFGEQDDEKILTGDETLRLSDCLSGLE